MALISVGEFNYTPVQAAIWGAILRPIVDLSLVLDRVI